ncbi:hypothetical protein T484DRAFT_1755492 [Baffinella frigidus]|nr:hypothetical protein T484DRAFT_1755492 [Cryptophyta sp. CCMP2293]
MDQDARSNTNDTTVSDADANRIYWTDCVLPTARAAELEARRFVANLTGAGAHACFQHSNAICDTPMTHVVGTNLLSSGGLDDYEDVGMRLEQGLVFISDVEGERYFGKKSIQTVAQMWLMDLMAMLFDLVHCYDDTVPWFSSFIKDMGYKTSAREKTIEARFPYITSWAQAMHTKGGVLSPEPDPSYTSEQLLQNEQFLVDRAKMKFEFKQKMQTIADTQMTTNTQMTTDTQMITDESLPPPPLESSSAAASQPPATPVCAHTGSSVCSHTGSPVCSHTGSPVGSHTSSPVCAASNRSTRCLFPREAVCPGAPLKKKKQKIE